MTTNQATLRKTSLTTGGKVLSGLAILVGLGAVVGGVGTMMNALPFPNEWLHNTPFHSYFLPGLILLAAVAGTQLVAAYALISRRAFEKSAAVLASCILIAWILAEIQFIGFRAPIQGVFLGLGALELLLSLLKLRSTV